MDIETVQKAWAEAVDEQGMLPELIVVFAEKIADIERERICAAIKAEDDHCATGDYMLDSDDCIRVARGQWQRPDYGSNAGAQATARGE